MGATSAKPSMSSSGLSRGSIHLLAPALAARWILGTRPRMTAEVPKLIGISLEGSVG